MLEALAIQSQLYFNMSELVSTNSPNDSYEHKPKENGYHDTTNTVDL